MSFIIGLLKIFFVLGFLITIHESGHFLMAKACKVKVNEFAIGFGPKILVRQGKETKYTLRLIPLGGYVDMLGEMERKDEKGSFSSSPIWKRILIVIAGATVNIVFGLVVYFSWVAVDFNQISTTVNSIISEYSDNLKELEPDDTIIEINGKKIHLKSDLDNYLSELNTDNVNLIVERNNEKKEINVKATQVSYKYVGIYYNKKHDNQYEIGYVIENSPAYNAGLKKGDKIIKINNENIIDDKIFSQSLENDDITFSIMRNNEEKEIKVTSEEMFKYSLGIVLKPAEANFKNRMYYGFWQTVSYIKEIGNSLKRLITGNIKIDQMMGPIGISETIVKTKGFSEFIYFLSIISLSLGVSNLLPIPALDGGRLLLLIIEAIRRKPLKEEIEIKIQLLGFSFLIILSLYIAFNDILRII